MSDDGISEDSFRSESESDEDEGVSEYGGALLLGVQFLLISLI